MIEEDAIFPVLPKWFTGPLHAEPVPATVKVPTTEDETHDEFPHAHTLLESLFYGVWKLRGINCKPSSTLPTYFSITFNHVLSPPVLTFRMPPIAPLQPLPGQAISPKLGYKITSSSYDPWHPFVPNKHKDGPELEASTHITEMTSNGSFPPTSTRIPVLPSTLRRHPSFKSAGSLVSTIKPSNHKDQPPTSNVHYIPVALDDSTIIGGEITKELFPPEALGPCNLSTPYLQLYRSAGSVFAVKEAMWDVLRHLTATKDPMLKKYGWTDDDYEREDRCRTKFDSLVQRYKDDMQIRLSLWFPLVEGGLKFPAKEKVSSGELRVQTRLRHAILAAREEATEEHFETPTRVVRLLIGVNGNH